MKRLAKIFTVILIVLSSIFTLTACEKEKIRVVSVEMDASSPTEIKVGEFDYSKYKILVTLNTGESRTLDLTEEMLPFDEYQKTYKAGLQTLLITYKNYSFEFTINVCKYEFTDVQIVSEEFSYDGLYHQVVVEGNYPVGTTITYPNGSQFKNVGKHEVKAVLSCEAYTSIELTGTMNITKATYDTSAFKFGDKDGKALFTYDGKEKEVVVTGVPSDLTVSYSIKETGAETNKVTQAGTYTVVAHIVPGPNYYDIPDMECEVTIEKGTYDLSFVKFNDRTVTYTGDPVEMSVTNVDALPSGVTVTYEGLENIDAGEYTITANFKGDELNYNSIPSLKAKLTIKKAKVSLTGINFDSASYTYDKLPHSVQYTGTLPTGITFAGYENNNQTNVGTYIVKANFIYRDTKNYEPIAPITATLEITKADLTGIKFENDSIVYDGYGHSLTATNFPTGVKPTYSITSVTEPGSYEITATFELSQELARNYNPIDPKKATLTIEKKNLLSSFSDVTFDYDGQLHMMQVELDEEERDWISLEYFVYNDSGAEVEFKGATEPGSYLVFARYVIDPSHKADYDAHYNEVARESAFLIISKMTYTPVFTNQKLTYTGSAQEVTVDLDEARTHFMLDFKVKYENNKRTAPGIQVGVAKFTLTEQAAKYYKEIPDTEFYFAIRNGSNRELYTPVFSGTQTTYDGTAKYISVSNLPVGITVEFRGNGQIVPVTGGHPITATFKYENEIAEYYYKLPDNGNDGFNTDVNGYKYRIVRLYIDKQLYSLTFNTSFVYDGNNKLVKPIGCPVWVDVEYEYQENVRTECGQTYHVTCKPSINDAEKAELYKVEDQYIEFTISKADVSYSYDNLTIKYDGQKHYITVLGLPEGIQAVSTGDGKVDVGRYPVVVRFINNSTNYNNISDQMVYLTIENNVIYCQEFVTYIQSPGSKLVSQFSTLRELLESKLDMEAFTLDWRVDYYADPEHIYPESDKARHGSSLTDFDFEFSETTENEELVIVTAKLTLNNGYICGDESIVGSMDLLFQLLVSKTEKIDISSFKNVVHDGMYITQGSSLKLLLKSSLPEYSSLTINFKGCYKDNGVKYLTDKTDSQADSLTATDFYFNYATWGNRYAEIELEISCRNGYCLFDGEKSYLTYKDTIEIRVNPKDTVDISYMEETLQNDVVVPQYSKFSEYVVTLVDSRAAYVSWKLFNKATQECVGTNETDFIFKDYLDLEYYCEIKAVVDSQYLFSDQDHLSEYSTEFNLTVEYREAIDFDAIKAAALGITDPLRQYEYIYYNYFSEVVLPEGVAYTVEVTDLDGIVHKVVPGDTDYQIMKAGSYFVRVMYYATGDKVVYDVDGYNCGRREITGTIDAKPRTIINMDSLDSFLNSKESTVFKYTTLMDMYKSGLEEFLNTYPVIEQFAAIVTLYQTSPDSSIDKVISTKQITSINDDIMFDFDFDNSSNNYYVEVLFNFGLTDSNDFIFDDIGSIQKSIYFNINQENVIAIDSPLLSNLENTTTTVKVGTTMKNLLDTLAVINPYVFKKVNMVYVDKTSRTVRTDKEVIVENGSDEYVFKSINVTDGTDMLIRLTVEVGFRYGYTILDSKGHYQNSVTFVTYINLTDTVKLHVSEAMKNPESTTFDMKQFDYVDKVVMDHWYNNNPSIMGINNDLLGNPITQYKDFVTPVGYKIEVLNSNSSVVKTWVSTSLNTSSPLLINTVLSKDNLTMIMTVDYKITNSKYVMDMSEVYSNVSSTSFSITYKVNYTEKTLIDLSEHEEFWTNSTKSLVPGKTYNNYEYYAVKSYLDSGKMSVWIERSSDKKYQTSSGKSYYISGSTIVVADTRCFLSYYFGARDGYYFGINDDGTPITMKHYEHYKHIKPIVESHAGSDELLSGSKRVFDSGSRLLNFDQNLSLSYYYELIREPILSNAIFYNGTNQAEIIGYAEGYIYVSSFVSYEVIVQIKGNSVVNFVNSSSDIVAYTEYKYDVIAFVSAVISPITPITPIILISPAAS